MELYDLYTKSTGSVISLEKFEEEVACLTGSNWSSESLFFAINFCSKHYREDLVRSLKETLDTNEREVLRYYMLAKAKRDIVQYEEGAEKYDATNKPQGDNKPSWFRKGINFNLFE